MESGTSAMNHQHQHQHQPFGPGPGAHGTGQSHCPGPAPAPGPGTHHKPFFYVQPQQPQQLQQPPFLPVQSVQWPVPLAMPLNYSPYYGGYPGFGYGLPLMPHFQPAPYMDLPGFVMPHTHHHLMDYRRLLNPHYYQSMAYHARRLRYQQNAPTRDVTSAEVQTEPVPPSGINPSETSNESSSLSASLSVKKDDRTLALNELAPAPSKAVPQKGSFIIETEEVMIECCASPAGLQVLHETSEMSRRFAQDVVHCSSIVQNSLLADDNVQTVKTDGKKEKSPQPCPDILLVVSPSANVNCVQSETTPVTHSRIKPSADVEATLNERNVNHSRINMAADIDSIRNDKNLKVLRLPFNAKYLAELQQIESSVWSADNTLVPSPEFIIDSSKESKVPSAEMPIAREENVQDKVVPVVHLPKTTSEVSKDVIPTFESPVVELERNDVAKQARVYGRMALKCSQNLLSDDSPMDGNLQDHLDTSFESLPAYLPLTSWLADFENLSYRKMPLTPQKLNKPITNRSFNIPVRRRKLDAEFEEATAVQKPKDGYKPKGKPDRRSMSDQECCVSQSYNENVSCAAKGQRLCTRCLSSQRIHKTSTSPAQVSKRKTTPFQPWNDVILPTCDACRGHSNKRFARKGSSPDVRTEMDVSENVHKWRLMEMRRELKKPLAPKQQSHVEKCSGSYSKSKERSCACGEQTQWHRIYHCPHGNAIREKDENCGAATSQQQAFLAHRWQTEKLWKSTPGHSIESLKNDLIRAQSLNLHKKSLPLSQGLQRKDTRC